MRSCARDTLAMLVQRAKAKMVRQWRAPVGGSLLLELCHRPFISSQCPLLAQSGHTELHCTCPLLGVKRTSHGHVPMSAFDPKMG